MNPSILASTIKTTNRASQESQPESELMISPPNQQTPGV
uniref:Uncharacterized protein n=1 Tax=Rhizophora mucronata TaxID=61149 RepID=A0A2P2PUD6_RHIMU